MLGMGEKPVVTVLNKIDLPEGEQAAPALGSALPKPVAISALKGTGVDALLEVIEQQVAGLTAS